MIIEAAHNTIDHLKDILNKNKRQLRIIEGIQLNPNKIWDKKITESAYYIVVKLTCMKAAIPPRTEKISSKVYPMVYVTQTNINPRD